MYDKIAILIERFFVDDEMLDDINCSSITMQTLIKFKSIVAHATHEKKLESIENLNITYKKK